MASVMHSCVAILFFYFAATISGQSEQGSCNIWGDPHLVLFPVGPQQQGMRMGYWCQHETRMLILKNRLIEIYVNVTEFPFWNEHYEIRLLSDPQNFCTITPTSQGCLQSRLLDVQTIGTGLDIVYGDGEELSLTINSYQIGQGRNVYDITVTQSYPLILASSGLCVTKSPKCRLESAINPFGRKRRKRAISVATATQVCDQFMAEANKTAKDIVGNTGSAMTVHARAACINDVATTGDSAWGQSTVNFVVLDALKTAKLGKTARRTKLSAAIPLIKAAADRAKAATESLMRRAYFEP